MQYTQRIGENAVVPVVVLDEVINAVPAAKSLFAGGIDVMEITLRTQAGLDSIKEVSEKFPKMLVGAGTVLTLDQAKTVVGLGAKFVVSPGFDKELVEWCVNNDITVVPGCVTPTEIMAAMNLGVDVIKFFPSNVYGGLAAMKSLSAPFTGIKFLPTGGINGQNIGEYAASSFIHTVGGSWVCTRQDIADNNWEKITMLCKDAVLASLGFEIAHIGVNSEDNERATKIVNEFKNIFGFEVKDGNTSAFAGSGIEVMKSTYLGKHGHIAVRTNNINRAVAFMKTNGYEVDNETAKVKGEKLVSIYLKKSIGDFAIHILQK